MIHKGRFGDFGGFYVQLGANVRPIRLDGVKFRNIPAPATPSHKPQTIDKRR